MPKTHLPSLATPTTEGDCAHSACLRICRSVLPLVRPSVVVVWYSPQYQIGLLPIPLNNCELYHSIS